MIFFGFQQPQDQTGASMSQFESHGPKYGTPVVNMESERSVSGLIRFHLIRSID
jgi:hypothetical protein